MSADTRLRYAYNTNGLAHHRLDDALSFLADTGYGGVALTLDVHHLDPYAEDALAALMRDPARRAALADAARRRAAGFTWEETARRTRAVYEEALACG